MAPDNVRTQEEMDAWFDGFCEGYRMTKRGAYQQIAPTIKVAMESQSAVNRAWGEGAYHGVKDYIMENPKMPLWMRAGEWIVVAIVVGVLVWYSMF